MSPVRHRFLIAMLILACTVVSLPAQEGFDFSFDLGIGAQSFEEDGETVVYQSIQLQPDVSFGNFGIGLALDINYSFTGGEGNEFTIREEDWDPSAAGVGFLELYLPKFRYVRWAQKGAPLFALLGSIDAGTLGNGFIMGGYTNTLFLPDRRIFGMQLDVDGRLFNFPLIGLETIVPNFASWNILGGRLFVRPLTFFDIPIINALQVGATYVQDSNPYYNLARDPDYPDGSPTTLAEDSIADDSAVSVFGMDVRLPILGSDLVSLAAFGDLVFQGDATGGMLGAGGRFRGFITYGAQLRFLGDDFIPVYFDALYDVTAAGKYSVYANGDSTTIPGYVGWFATAGFSIIDDLISANVGIDGPFGSETTALPGLRGQFNLAEGLVPGITASAHYTKTNIETFDDLISPVDASIGAQINYQTGPALISLVYNVTYDPAVADDANAWKVTSGIQTSVSLF